MLDLKRSAGVAQLAGALSHKPKMIYNIINLLHQTFLNTTVLALAGVAHRPTRQKVTGSIPSQGTGLGGGPCPWLGHVQEATN